MTLPAPHEIIRLVRDGGREGRAEIESMAGPDDSAALCAALVAATDPPVRVALASVLSSLAHPGALPCLLNALDDPEPGVVAAVADAIGNSAYEHDLAPDLRRRLGARLLELLQDDGQREDVRTGAEYALGLLRFEDAVPALTRALGAEAPIMRWNAAEALTHIGDRTAIPALRARVSEETHPRVLRFLDVALEELTRDRSGDSE